MNTEARLAHLDLLNDYCRALDTRDWGLLASLFTDDAVFTARMVLPGNKPGPEDMRVEGPRGILGALQPIWDHLSATHHLNTNHVIAIAPDGKSGKGSCYLRAYHAGGGNKAHLYEESLGQFEFESVLVGSKWKIRRWNEMIMIMLGTREVFGH
jgi:hypothetical protein